MLGKKGGPFFRWRSCSFYIKNKLKSEIFDDKKKFSVITKNLNWAILTKNLVIFKRWDGVKDENTLIIWGFTEKPHFKGGGGVHKNPIYRGELSKTADLDSL